jgi:hypothetical protein
MFTSLKNNQFLALRLVKNCSLLQLLYYEDTARATCNITGLSNTSCLTLWPTPRRVERSSTSSAIARLTTGLVWLWWRQIPRWRWYRTRSKCWLSRCRSGEGDNSVHFLWAPETRICSRRPHGPKSCLVFSSLAMFLGHL